MLNLEVLFLIEYSYGREPFCILLSQIFSQIWGFALHMAADTSAGGCEPAWGADAGRSEKKLTFFVVLPGASSPHAWCLLQKISSTELSGNLQG